MGSAYLSGSITKATVDGVTYYVPADASYEVTPPRFKNEAVATSGVNLRKMIKQAQEVKCVITANPDEVAKLIKLAESAGSDVTLSFVTAEGSIWTSPGWIDFEKWETESFKGTLTMFPRTKWEQM